MSEKCTVNEKKCSGRREFLVSASALAGGLILNLTNASSVSAKSETSMPVDDTVIKLDENNPLNKVGGSQTVDTPAGKIIIAHTENGFSAVSAICTHKNGELKYDEKANQFVCPVHKSKFGLDGSNAGGPAKSPLKVSKIQKALILLGE